MKLSLLKDYSRSEQPIPDHLKYLDWIILSDFDPEAPTDIFIAVDENRKRAYSIFDHTLSAYKWNWSIVGFIELNHQLCQMTELGDMLCALLEHLEIKDEKADLTYAL